MKPDEVDSAQTYSDASYRAIFENAGDAIFVHDLDTGAIVDVNRKACETYGYTREEFLRLDVAELGSGIPPYTGADAARYIARACAGEPQRFEWHRRNKDGSLHWDEVALNRVTLSGVDRILAFTREITERKEWESAIVNSENRLSATINSALDSIITMDTGGRIVGFNPAAETCFGWRAAEVHGRTLADLIIPERSRAAHARGLEHYLQTGQSRIIGRRVEMCALRRDGSEFPVELAITAVQGRDGELFIGYLRDISERRAAEQERLRLETQLRQAQKMEAIGHLAGGIAHDFNNILTGVVGYLELARGRAAALKDADLSRFLDEAAGSAERAGELIRQLLTFSRGRDGNPESLDLSRIVRRCAKLLHSTLPSSTEFEFQLHDQVPPILMDPVQAEQVLLNLCINARDAMEGKGHITIRACVAGMSRRFCSSCRQGFSGQWVELRVTDSGPGIEPAHLERMFEPFYSTKPSGQGSGMGLAIAHGIVHEAGGHILVESTPGKGACFRILLPADAGGRRTEAADEQPAVRQPRRLRGRVMVIDDEQSVGHYMVDQLSGWGIDAVHHCSPEAALNELRENETRPDALIVDYTMPGMSGLDFVARLRTFAPALPVTMYSGYIEEIPREAFAELGLTEPLRKPVDPDALYTRLRTHLDAG